MISNFKSLNYKIIDLDKSYNFHIKSISIRVYTKKLQLKKKADLHGRLGVLQ
jgi:hypothetical protein